jgi:hypothetical protein
MGGNGGILGENGGFSGEIGEKKRKKVVSNLSLREQISLWVPPAGGWPGQELYGILKFIRRGGPGTNFNNEQRTMNNELKTMKKKKN